MVAGWLRDEGFETCIPALEPSLVIRKREPEDAVGKPLFASSWSERHVAFAAGLGTFGLSTHLITRVGKAGRFGSIITTAEFEPTARPYREDPFAYCTRCGTCTKRCPVDALTLENGKDYQACWVYMEETKIRFKPRYGCGKCQLLVPCETGIPNKRFIAVSAVV
jgi:epoxyqueuosine reductase QueG